MRPGLPFQSLGETSYPIAAVSLMKSLAVMAFPALQVHLAFPTLSYEVDLQN